MARRNIFDRDTRAGDYSDTLGNFLENIPSIYGQLAKEKRLEKQYVDEKNFRTTQYNNQILQQSKNNTSQEERDQLNKEKFNAQKKNSEFNKQFEILKLSYEQTGNYEPIAQLHQQYFPNTFNAEQANKFKAGFDISKDFDADIRDWNSLPENKQYSKSDELNELIDTSARLSRIGNPRNQARYSAINKNLVNKKKEYVANSGSLIRDTDLWSGMNGQAASKIVKTNEKQILALEKQANVIQSEVDKILPSGPNNTYNERDEKRITIFKSRLEEKRKQVADLSAKNIEVSNTFRYPKFISDSEEDDFASASSGRTTENFSEYVNTPPSETTDSDDLVFNLEDIDTNILEDIDNGNVESIDDFINVINSEDKDTLRNYVSNFRGNKLRESSRDKNDSVELVEEPIRDVNVINSDNKDALRSYVSDFGGRRIEGFRAKDDLVTETVNVGESGGVGDDLPLPIVTAQDKNRFAENIEKEAELPDLGLVGKTPSEIAQDAAQYDVPSIPETGGQNQVSDYLTKGLEEDLDLIIKKSKTKSNLENVSKEQFERQSTQFQYKKVNKSILELEDKIKDILGDYINPISGDISISNENYKNQILKRLEKKFGNDFYSILASMSNVKK
tara:strand:+ start:5193 stop:7049 length:1857 start_codon:yes stop_codon:yes gene_type:complete